LPWIYFIQFWRASNSDKLFVIQFCVKTWNIVTWISMISISVIYHVLPWFTLIYHHLPWFTLI
jgi:hypothetical protein